jgi:hypothetical protein
VVSGESSQECASDLASSFDPSTTAQTVSPSVITQPAACTDITDPSEPGVSMAIYPVTPGGTDTAQLVCQFAQEAANGTLPSGSAD